MFLDARPQSQYEEGHIHGALSLPWQDATTAFADIADQLELIPSSPIATAKAANSVTTWPSS